MLEEEARKRMNRDVTIECILKILKEKEVVYSDLDELLENVKLNFKERAKL